jgi:hypothetical protein
MLDRIYEHAFDLLEADSRLSVGFGGVKRIQEGVEPLAGYVNIFDWALEDDSKEARPAIYAGVRNAQGADRQEFEVIADSLVDYRNALLSIVVVCLDKDRKTAKDARKQLVANVRAILSSFDNIVQAGYWYRLKETQSFSSFKSAGGGVLGNNEAMTILQFEASYKKAGGEVVV